MLHLKGLIYIRLLNEKCYSKFKQLIYTFALLSLKAASVSRGALPYGKAEMIPVEPARVMPAKGVVELLVFRFILVVFRFPGENELVL